MRGKKTYITRSGQEVLKYEGRNKSKYISNQIITSRLKALVKI